jgi:hypothetical protein
MKPILSTARGRVSFEEGRDITRSLSERWGNDLSARGIPVTSGIDRRQINLRSLSVLGNHVDLVRHTI